MAANIPFTSLFYEDGETSSESEQQCNSVMNVLNTLYPDISSIIYRSGLHKLYESNTVTIFIPEKFIYDNRTTVSDAIKFCKNITSIRCLDRIALNYYAKFFLQTLSTPFDLTIESFPNGLITVNGSPIISSIQCTNGFIHVVKNE